MAACSCTTALPTASLRSDTATSPSPTIGGVRERLQLRQISDEEMHGRFFPAMLLFIWWPKRRMEGSPAILMMPRSRERDLQQLRKLRRQLTAGDRQQSKCAPRTAMLRLWRQIHR